MLTYTPLVTSDVVAISPNLHSAAAGDKDELVKFWGRRVKGKGHNETTTWCQISTLGGIFSHGHILMKLRAYSTISKSAYMHSMTGGLDYCNELKHNKQLW